MPTPHRLLDQLDDVLLEVRHLFRSPDFRRLVLRSVEVELSTLRLLRAVERHASDPSVGDVADTLGIDQSTASRQVEQAVKTGYLARQRSADDARRSQLTLTADGAAVLAEANRSRRKALGQVTADWSDQDLADLVRLLRELRDGFDRVSE